ncbi:MAG: hypothetical protein E6640_06660 [Actinomyces urogenitalis]|uniref:hypothetical protein n=1 Tax=Actinomyces urogenitalis TaxID=103621 RepID=UPI002914A0DC|nr:hypothetical protein [Actinomyces urogenitalis]MDU6151896.1 hypothetical protein [Actinomyces urogenitalis]
MSTAQTSEQVRTPRLLRRRAAGESSFLSRHGSQVLVVVSELVLILAFSLASPYFLQLANFSALLLDASVYVLLALGLTFVIATGGIDLTPGFGIAFTGVCLAVAMRWAAGMGLGPGSSSRSGSWWGSWRAPSWEPPTGSSWPTCGCSR